MEGGKHASLESQHQVTLTAREDEFVFAPMQFEEQVFLLIKPSIDLPESRDCKMGPKLGQ